MGGPEVLFAVLVEPLRRIVETYWEFASANPRVTVASLRPPFQTFPRRHQVTHRYVPVYMEVIIHNYLMFSSFSQSCSDHSDRITARLRECHFCWMQQ